MSKNVVIIGTQWGDEGKGKVVDLITDKVSSVVRFQGGHNAGHTLVIDGQKTVVEGYWATECFYRKSKEAGAIAPVLEQVYRTLYEGSDPRSSVIELMSRGLKAEGS